MSDIYTTEQGTTDRDFKAKPGQEVLEAIKAGKREWDALTAQEWNAVYTDIRQFPGTLEHTIAHMDGQEIQAAATTLHRIKAILAAAGRDTWETITAEELLNVMDRRGGL